MTDAPVLFNQYGVRATAAQAVKKPSTFELVEHEWRAGPGYINDRRRNTLSTAVAITILFVFYCAHIHLLSSRLISPSLTLASGLA